MQVLHNGKRVAVSTYCPQEPTHHIVLVETEREPKSYGSSDEISEMFDNMAQRAGEMFVGDRQSLALTVISYQTSYIHQRQDADLFLDLEKLIRQANQGDVPADRTGVVIVSRDFAQKIDRKAIQYMNVVIPEKDNKKPVGINLPITTDFKYAVSVPSYAWAVTKNPSNNENITLVGVVMRAIGNVLRGKTEGSILRQMRKYHKGDYGQLVLVDTRKKFISMLKSMRSAEILSLDTETDNLLRVGNTLLMLQVLAINEGKLTMWAMPAVHPETPWTSKDIRFIQAKLKEFFEYDCEGQVHIYQNAKFDIHQLMNFLQLEFYSADVYDTQAGAFSLEENQKFLKQFNVSPYSLEYLETTHEYTRPKELVISKSDRGRMVEFSITDIAEYGVLDVLTPYFLYLEQTRIADERNYPGFENFILHQMGPMIMAMTEMEHRGIPIDIEYLDEIASPVGPLAERIRTVVKEITEMVSAQKANDYLIKHTSSFQSKGLFGTVDKPQLWDITKKEHLNIWFFDILGLEPTGFGKDEEPSLDARFQRVYRHTPEVAAYTKYQKLTKLMSAFAEAIHKFMKHDPDMKVDKRLRPVFGYLVVLTGRSSTEKPSTQQIPTHGDDAKTIKKQFAADKKKKRVLVKADFSAHEVRVSGNVSADEAICEVVDTVNTYTLRYRIADESELGAALEELKKADIHVLNYKVFYGKDITKKDPRRQDAKTAVFSVTYGSKEKSVAAKMLLEALVSAEDKYYNHRSGKAKLDKEELSKVRKEIKYLQSKRAESDYLEKAKDLLQTLFDKWGTLAEFIEDLQVEAARENVIFGPHGRPRHLWGYLHPDKFTKYAMDRRAFNSLSQGLASDIGYTSIYLLWKARWKLLVSKGYKIYMNICNAVHDSNLTETEIKYLPMVAYLVEHAMTSLSRQHYKKYFDIRNRSDYGFDMEIGFDESTLTEWDKRPEGMESIVKKLAAEVKMEGDELEDVLHDIRIIGKLRKMELTSKQPYAMTLAKREVYDKILPKLRMFE